MSVTSEDVNKLTRPTDGKERFPLNGRASFFNLHSAPPPPLYSHLLLFSFFPHPQAFSARWPLTRFKSTSWILRSVIMSLKRSSLRWVETTPRRKTWVWTSLLWGKTCTGVWKCLCACLCVRVCVCVCVVCVFVCLCVFVHADWTPVPSER